MQEPKGAERGHLRALQRGAAEQQVCSDVLWADKLIRPTKSFSFLINPNLLPGCSIHMHALWKPEARFKRLCIL